MISLCIVRKNKKQAVELLKTLKRIEVKEIGQFIINQDRTDPIAVSYLDWAEIMWWLIPVILTIITIGYNIFGIERIPQSGNWVDGIGAIIEMSFRLLTIMPALIVWIIYLALRVWLGIV